MKFIIYSAGYDHDIGGIIVLHKLCHHLNELGHTAYIHPVIKDHLPRYCRIIYNLIDIFLPKFRKAFRRNPTLNTPLRPIFDRISDSDTVVIYPEAIGGNPLGATNVVRWFLHEPGFHNRDFHCGSGEFHIDFNEFLKGYQQSGNHVSAHRLLVLHFPTEIYNLEGALPDEDRKGAAYCVRKGKFDPDQVDLADAICIDGLSHQECARIFRQVRYFFSFDPYTAYSWFAALCGAVSVVLPPKGMSKEDWYADASNRLGIAFGPKEEQWARQTRHLVLPHIEASEAASRTSVSTFVEEVRDYFGITS
ncbi:MAG: hypothetical protein ACK4IC_07460 [Erythrobacter sp.]